VPSRKGKVCPKCGRPLEFYAGLDGWWCGEVGCQVRPGPAAPGNRKDDGRRRETPVREPDTVPPDIAGTPPAADLAPLLDDLRALIRRYVIVDDAQADALVLWVAHTHALSAAEATPYLSLTSAEKRSGKTRLLEVLSLLSARPWLTGRVTAAVLVRKLAAETPTLLLDESDAAFRAEKEYAATLQAILNSGYRHGGCASLCVKAGKDFELRDFPVFGAKAIAGIGSLPDTIADRAIPITLKRRAPNEPIARFRWRDVQEEAKPLREGLACWASNTIEALTEARPEIPPALDDRAADVWEPLLAIGDLAGGEWSQRVRSAALALSVGEQRDDDSLGVRLLIDIQAIFAEEKDSRLSSRDLADALVALEEAPWGDLRGKPLDTRGLARRLRPYGVRPHVIRLDNATPRGYERTDFGDAWGRYIPTPEITATSATSATKGQSLLNLDGEDVADVADVAPQEGIHAGTDNDAHDDVDEEAIPPELTGQRHYLVALGAELGFPNISDGGVGIPAGQHYYLAAARTFKDADIDKATGALEALASQRSKR